MSFLTVVGMPLDAQSGCGSDNIILCPLSLLGNLVPGYLDSLRDDTESLRKWYRLVTKYVTDSAKKADHVLEKWYEY